MTKTLCRTINIYFAFRSLLHTLFIPGLSSFRIPDFIVVRLFGSHCIFEIIIAGQTSFWKLSALFIKALWEKQGMLPFTTVFIHKLDSWIFRWSPISRDILRIFNIDKRMQSGKLKSYHLEAPPCPPTDKPFLVCLFSLQHRVILAWHSLIKTIGV